MSLSGGRVIVGAGVGWMKEEFETLRTEPFEERGKVTDEYIAAFRELWTSDNPSYSGKYCNFSNIVFLPKPVQKPTIPIWIGGHSKAGDSPRRAPRRRLASHRRRADDSAGTRGRRRRYVDVTDYAEKAGRDPNRNPRRLEGLALRP
jgi:alkanesulfonate monooxygenase SsuD/methylene tetrahydromethanopterin reductase-like flavin-dependent oxidoreductase (luciferase family)